MKVAIASGKGGTGKSTISSNLTYLLSKKHKNIVLLDCDVEEPNCHIFLKPEFEFQQSVYIKTPIVDEKKCTNCGKCSEVCQFNAIASIKNKTIIFDDLCHGCESCKINCPQNAIFDGKREVGKIEYSQMPNFDFVQGKSRVGEAMSPPLIKAVKKYADEKNYDIQILDCPPGTSCPVINAVSGVDYVVLVTEPTPFGFYDLKLAVDVMRKLKLPFGIVINRSSSNDKLIEEWAEKENIEIITKIPDDIEIAKIYSKGELILKTLKEYEKYFLPLINLIERVTR